MMSSASSPLCSFTKPGNSWAMCRSKLFTHLVRKAFAGAISPRYFSNCGLAASQSKNAFSIAAPPVNLTSPGPFGT
ncbi:hypothetical protein D3C73_1391760 [compost metagenome]